MNDNVKENIKEIENENTIDRRIKSYAIRGKVSPAHKQAYADHWEQYGCDVEDGLVDYQVRFGRDNFKVLEIGFGMGKSLCQMVQDNPQQDFIGVEVHTPGVGRILMDISEVGCKNFIVFKYDAIDVLAKCIADNSLDRVQLFFPDPWHKARHHKRRIVQQTFIDSIAAKLKPGGIFHMATDWENYAEHMMLEMNQNTNFENVAGQDQYSEQPEYRPTTKFEVRGQNLGHGVWDLLFKKK
ncbi:MAG: tRNA (guanosine(46)-N7)-methyltransferase TrmB [Saccharospirillaceae bacterium]|nr:tRNA (guanosine(46)-N7)-methyltransferase TrmB [Pseudomonadales bacterium]NRB81337.1 tRNA (guanosine(46)-N7)-methyltransferase TrmB [Saccharospirillaceae bacterium]